MLTLKHTWWSLSFCPLWIFIWWPVWLTFIIVAVEYDLLVTITGAVIVLCVILETLPSLIRFRDIFVELRLVGILDNGISIGWFFINAIHLSPRRHFFLIIYCEIVLQRLSGSFDNQSRLVYLRLALRLLLLFGFMKRIDEFGRSCQVVGCKRRVEAA